MLRIAAIAVAGMVTWLLMSAPAAAVASVRQCPDEKEAGYYLEHVLPLFSDTSASASAFRLEEGIEAVDSLDADVVTDAALCALIEAKIEARHSQATAPGGIGPHTVYSLRVGRYHLGIVEFHPEPGYESTGWSTLYVLDEALEILTSVLV